MLKHFYLTLLSLFCFFGVNAQNSEVQQWAERNPAVLFIENSDATTELISSLEAKGVEYIIYFDEISLSDIEQFEAQTKSEIASNLDEGEGMAIKKWLAQNSEVKIIKRSFYDQLDTAKQNYYESIGALILIGEEITLEDINNYE